MLDRRRGQCIAQLVQQRRARFVGVGKHAYFYQFVAAEIAVDLLHYGCGQAVVADHDYRVEGVGAGAQGAPLCGGDFEDHDGVRV